MNVRCLILGHKYYRIQKLSDVADKVGCRKCGKMWALNKECRIFLPWDKEFEEFYKFLNKVDEVIIKNMESAIR